MRTPHSLEGAEGGSPAPFRPPRGGRGGRGVRGGRGGRGAFAWPTRPNACQTTSPNPPSPTPQTPPPPLGKLVQTLETKDLKDLSQTFTDSATIQHVETITSYNWADKKGAESTILVPGKPPLWAPPKTPPQLSQDNGYYFRDKNAARYPKHPIEPAVVACLATDASLAAKVDIVACGSTLGNLLRLVRGQDRTFRMLVEKVSNTVFLVRRENSPTELIPDVRGYGHTFPEAYTTWEPEVKGSASHQRLLRYSFAGLSLIIRAEADGYLKESDPTKSANIDHPSFGLDNQGVSLDGLASALSDVSVSPLVGKLSTTVQVTAGGNAVDQRQVFELKTRTILTKLTKDHLDEELPRLWVSQIPNFILAFHTRGLFESEDIQIKNVRADIDKWEKDHAADLACLAALVRRILEVVSASEEGKLELCCTEVGRLEVREQLPGTADVLSPEVRARWEEASDLPLDVLCDGENDNSEVHGQAIEESLKEDNGLVWNDNFDKDYTGCSDACGYCGRCTY
ncbi:hypothetical protein B0T25DRAFT_463425 [Lasiosphaeria hispida]|uniref:Geranylgeranyl pyrophosphate synthetase n=1 Tax=Lasiosphaeria hispida TaxID=260671 RepID=A0AAJ0M8Y6_9PEZI|nr:hypothetical protein B0T25DRAFT_463425 [Lasiosphaeria hispida]